MLIRYNSTVWGQTGVTALAADLLAGAPLLAANGRWEVLPQTGAERAFA